MTRQMPGSFTTFFFFFIALKSRVEWYKNLRALNTSPPRNRFTFLPSSCSQTLWAQVGLVLAPSVGQRAFVVLSMVRKREFLENLYHLRPHPLHLQERREFC